jgi:SAM-dependent methyltransferase
LSFDPDLASHSSYLGRTLEAMTKATKYADWILSSFQPYLGRRLVEVGAGQGNFSRLLLQTSPEAFLGLEPDPAMFRVLERALAGINNVTLIPKFLSEVHQELPFIPDTVLYVNVLEHIRDDAGELRTVYRALSPQGRVCIFVPALQILYGTADASMGHHRRYEREGLSDLVSSAGFRVVKISYFDCVGIIPWFILFRLLKSEALKPSQVRIYDKLIVPLLRRAESVCPPPWGKNLLIVGQKP